MGEQQQQLSAGLRAGAGRWTSRTSVTTRLRCNCTCLRLHFLINHECNPLALSSPTTAATASPAASATPQCVTRAGSCKAPQLLAPLSSTQVTTALPHTPHEAMTMRGCCAVRVKQPPCDPTHLWTAGAPQTRLPRLGWAAPPAAPRAAVERPAPCRRAARRTAWAVAGPASPAGSPSDCDCVSGDAARALPGRGCAPACRPPAHGPGHRTAPCARPDERCGSETAARITMGGQRPPYALAFHGPCGLRLQQRAKLHPASGVQERLLKK